MTQSAAQLDMFSHVLSAYAAVQGRPLDNTELYRAVAQRASLPKEETQHVEPIGKSGTPHNTYQRRIRWHQQTLKRLGLLERVEGARGIWRLTGKAQRDLHPICRPWKMLAFSTDLGVAVWGAAQDVFSRLEDPIMLCFTSPPYPLRKERAYGNPDSRRIISFLCETLAPIIDNLAPEGSLVLNLSNDIFEPGSPARSTYLERLIITLEDEFGLALMDRIIWNNPSKPPGPVQWASKTRQQLNVAWEPVLWFAKDPKRVKSDNRRVLEPHSERQLALIARGGEMRASCYGDGAYRLHPGSYGKPTEGRIPRNVILQGHRCPWGDRYRKAATKLGLPVHGAGMPYDLAAFFIRYLTEEGDLTVDPYGGRIMTGRAAESLGRRWLCSEMMLEYASGGAELFRDAPGFDAPLDPHRLFAA